MSGCYSAKNVTIKDKKIKFEIWDTAGQEQYHSIAKMYFLDASVCILVYDITARKSFEELKKFWIDEIREVCESDTGKSKFIIKFYL
jgi:small GTP-binding protein